MTHVYSVDPRAGHLGVTLGDYAGDGVRIDACHPRDLISKAGLAAGDIITSIDGQAVQDFADALDMMVALKRPFTIEAGLCPERPQIATSTASALAAGWLAVYATAPLVVAFGSIEPTTKYGGLGSAGVAVILAYALNGRNLRTARNTCLVLFVTSIWMVVVTCQEVRRCAGPLCDGPTMYGTEADCRAVCFTAYASLHWPAVGASILATAIIVRAALRFVSLVESIDALPSGWWQARD
jgi:hypothetical protein